MRILDWTRIQRRRVGAAGSRAIIRLGLLVLPHLRKGSDEATKAVSRALLAGLLLVTCVLLVEESDFRHALERQISHPALYRLRNLIGSPPLDSRIKIFAFDDRTVAHELDFDLPLLGWRDVLGALGRRRPALVLIDKLFDRTYPAADVAAFSQGLDALGVPVAAISFLSPQPIEFRELMVPPPSVVKVRGDLPNWLAGEAAAPYGASAKLAASFSMLGHSLYDGDSFVSLAHRLADGSIMPHASLAAAKTVALEGARLAIDGRAVPVDRRGKTLVNFRPKRVFLERSYSMLALVERARRGLDISVVEPGDYVVLLPAMYTGNTDWRETPFGPMPGGYYITAVLNDVLSGNWLANSNAGSPLGILLVVASLLVGLRCNSRQTFLIVGALGASVFCGVILLFWQAGMAVEWVVPLIAAVLAAAVASTIRNQADQLESMRMSVELETATLVQNSLVPDNAYADGRMKIHAHLQSASECGGDWWSHFHTADGRAFILIGDAVGHGVSAALVTAVAYSVRTLLKTAGEANRAAEVTPQQILEMVDTLLKNMKSEMAMMTFLVAAIDWQQSKVEFAVAGHIPALLFPQNADDDRLVKSLRYLNLNASSNPLGYSTKSFGSIEAKLRKGDRLIMLSDGLVENEASPGRPFGNARLRRALAEVCTKSPQEICTSLIGSYEAFVGSYPPGDDFTLVAVEITSLT